MELAVFLSAVLALLIAPGPTNTLMGLAGAQKGVPGVLRLMPAELAGYLTTVLPLVFLGAEVLEQWPQAAVILKLAAAIWVMVLAFKLWGKHADGGQSGAVTLRKIYITTMLNPKALVFGLVLLPAPAEPEFWLRLGLFCLMVVAIAGVWGLGGRLAQVGSSEDGRRLRLLQRVASVWLAFVSLSLLVNVVRAGIS